MREMQPPRTAVRQVRCPACRALPGQRCVGVRGKLRTANHMERVLAYGQAPRP